MKRRRPQWQSSMCTMLSFFTIMVIYASGEAYQGELRRRLQTVPPILQPIPPNEVDVTPAPSIDCGNRCPSSQPAGGGREPTFYPSREDPPTPVPTMVTVPEPTPQPVSDTQTPQPVEPQTPQPIEPQTPQPVEPQTPQPNEPQTPQPVEPQTPQPVEPQTPQPVEPQTPQPVEPQPTDPNSPQPVDTQTPQPVEPQTPQPVEQPVPAPTKAPVVVKTSAPTRVPTVEVEPTTSAPIPNPTQFQLTDPPTSQVQVVPINPFVLSLGFDEPQTGTAQDLQILTSEVNRILTETLTVALRDANTNEDVTLERVDLTVTPQLRRRQADNMFHQGGRRLRALQQETVNFDVSGTARYSIAAGSNVSPEQLAFDTNTAVADTMNDPATQEALTTAFQNNTESEALSNTDSVSAQVQAPTGNDGSQKPTTVATVFGFILVGLGALVLGMYGWAFYKKRRKRRRQRKRDRERGLSETLNTTNIANTTASMGSMNSSINRSRSSPASKMMVLPPTEFEEDSSSAEEQSGSAASTSVDSEPPADNAVTRAVPDSTIPSSDSDSSASDPYAGIDSESSSKSDFTRELELAASLDRRSWIETQRQRSAMDPNGGYIRYPSQYEVEGVEVQESSGEGVKTGAAVGIAAAGAAAVAAKSYPYGDEEDSYDSDNVSVDLSEVKNPNADDLLIDGEEGVEWTAEGVWSPYDGYTKREIEPAEKSVSSLSDSRMTDSRSGKQHDRGVWMKSWSSIDSFRDRRRRESKDSNAFMKSWSSIDSARETKSRSTLLGSLAEDTEVEEELIVQAADRGVEVETVESRTQTISTEGTSNAVRMSPTASAATELAVAVAENTKVEEGQDDEDSVLTQDILKEVSRLARFVKKYDKKRERKLLKDRERKEKAALAIKDSQSFPSVGYDAMSDSHSALRKGPVEASPRRERTALTNPVEETDESDESERSWSTTSNANRAFDDDGDTSLVVYDSEIDVSDDSSVEEGRSETASDISRLGITPFSVQRVVGKPQTNPVNRSRRAESSAPETSRPPVTGNNGSFKGLPPLPDAADTPHEESPETTRTPVHTAKRAMLRVKEARQNKSVQMSTKEQTPTKQSREVGLTEDALHELSDENGPAGVTSPYQQQKGALSVLRKNEAILDTASSHFTDGVTSSQYEQALKAGIVTQQEQRLAYLKRNSFKRAHRVPRDPPAQRSDSASVQATDEKRSPTGYEQKDASGEMRVPSAQPAPQTQKQAVSEDRVPWSRPSAPKTPTETQSAPAHSTNTTTPRRASFRPGGFQPTNGGSTQDRSSPAQSASSGIKRAAPEAAPLTPRALETAPAPVSPAMKSPPRRKKKSNSTFNNVISMFESKPKNPIAPVGENWQFNGATR